MPRKSRQTKRVQLPAEYERGFLYALDRRTELARALKERFANIANDLGGVENLSTIKAGLLERYIWLEAFISRMEVEVGNAPDIKTAMEISGKLTQALNTLYGLATKSLGLERKAVASPWLVPMPLEPESKQAADGAGGTEDK